MQLSDRLSHLSKAQLIERIIELEVLLMTPKPESLPWHLLPIHLTKTELAIMVALFEAKGRWLATDWLVDALGHGGAQSLKTHKCTLNSKFRRWGVAIDSSYGHGYRLSAAARNALIKLAEETQDAARRT